MRTITIDLIQERMILNQDIYSELGGIIFKKGTILKERDQEILRAFGITKVEIDQESDVKENQEKVANKTKNQLNPIDDFNTYFKNALKVIDIVLKNAQGNASIPIMAIREALYPLLQDQYINPKYLINLKSDSNDFTKYASHHALSVSLLSYAIGKWVGLEKNEWIQLALAGILHDIGMSRIPSHILYSKNKLVPYEYEEIKMHTFYGYKMLNHTMGLSKGTHLAVLQHHEREDGSGYPLHFKEQQIHFYAKIVAVADIFHAMISKRNYRSEYSPYLVIDHLLNESYQKLNSFIVRTFAKHMVNLSIGNKVILSNGMVGDIIYIDQNSPTRPMIKTREGIINLAQEINLHIKEVFKQNQK
ncbi:MAG: HD-GYP domain-containing protein [Tepidibacillus sp.]